MFGMIKKDMLMVFNNIKSVIVGLIIYIFFTFTNDTDFSFIIPFLTVMICISTFSYDDFNNWHSYAVALPNGRENVVKSKYISTILLIIIATIVGLVLSLIIGTLSNYLNLESTLSSIGGSLVAIIVLISILYPVLFKYGSEKGRIGLFIIWFGIFAIIALLSKVVNINISDDLITFLYTYGLVIFGLLSIASIIISYIISNKIYKNKEF